MGNHRPYRDQTCHRPEVPGIGFVLPDFHRYRRPDGCVETATLMPSASPRYSHHPSTANPPDYSLTPAIATESVKKRWKPSRMTAGMRLRMVDAAKIWP